MSPDHATADAFALRVRAMRSRLAEVEPTGLEIGGQVVGAGDEIVTTRNDRRLVTDTGHWVRNGDRWTVERRTSRGRLRVRSLEGRGRVWLPRPYVEGDVALAYAVTTHKAQGMTVDRGLLLADEATRDLSIYVGMTRGRHSNDVFVGADPGVDYGPADDPPTPAAGRLAEIAAEQDDVLTLQGLVDEGSEIAETSLGPVIRQVVQQSEAPPGCGAHPPGSRVMPAIWSRQRTARLPWLVGRKRTPAVVLIDLVEARTAFPRLPEAPGPSGREPTGRRERQTEVMTRWVLQGALVVGLALTACGGRGLSGGTSPSSSTTRDSSTTTTTLARAAGSGVEGTVSASPTCPVERVDQPCPPRPVQTEVRVVRGDGSVAARGPSGADGRFRIEVAPGRYRLEADYPGGPGRGCTPTDVAAEKGVFTRADVDCDTGIR